MGNVAYTDEQLKVIQTRDANLLVSAAAGSGKTAVLTERILSLITDKDRPVDIDRLLVVTFTKAAAAEMRERIGKAINERLALTPDDSNLTRQLTLLHNAQITTIDSFCLFLLRNNFGSIGLDPAFRVMDDGERKLLMKDTMDGLFESCYREKENERFFRLVECYGKDGKDDALTDIILELYEYSMSHPYPLEWLDAASKGYEAETFADLEECVWWQEKQAENERLLEKGMETAKRAAALCRETNGPMGYLDAVLAFYDLFAAVKETGSFERRNGLLCRTQLPGLKRAKKTDDKELCDKVKGCRDRMKDIRNRLADCYYDTEEHIMSSMRGAKSAAEELVRLTKEFIRLFSTAKRERNVVDFSDLEHFALDVLLQKSEDGELIPTRAAKEYQDYFACVMVDEYQDSNYVQEYLLKTVARSDNYFMVGDIKQSIYRFRLARPDIFIQKYAVFQEKGTNIRIDLNRNFRSRMEVLDGVNDVFEAIMTGESAGMAYDDRAKLYLGAKYPDIEGQFQDTELVLIERPEKFDRDLPVENAKELEAFYIAEKIRDMIRQPFQVTDAKSGGTRPVSYGDIVILLRSAGDYEEAVRKVLEDRGIPVYSTTKTGYFSTLEVRTIINTLQVLDNPRQDIPLYGMMTSFIGGFTEEEAARVRAGKNQKNHSQCLYDDVCSQYQELKTAGGAKKDVLFGKLDRILRFIEEYRKKAKYTGIRELLEEILQKTGYLDYVTALPGGKQRRANLKMLLERSSDFEAMSYQGLFHFVRYINQLKEQDVDYGEAGLLDEHADVVRIMTIHKSKGLEFPVCFLCGLGRMMNRKEATKPVLLESRYGMGIDDIDPKLRVRRPTLVKKIMAGGILADSCAEEMRILYVAMTRAKEKLIMTGVVTDLGNALDKWRQGGTADYDDIRQYSSYLDFVLAAYVGGGKESYIHCKTTEEIMALAGENEVKTGVSKELLRGMETQADPLWEEELEERFAETYPYPELAGLYTKTTVSELKKAAYEDTEAYQMFDTQKKEAYIPKFIRGDEEKSLGTKRGTAVHRIMELLDYKALPEQDGLTGFVGKTIEENVASGRLAEELAGLLSVDKCVRFLETKLAGRMSRADRQGRLYKEKSFFMGIPAKELKESFPEKETVLVQGVIDVYFEEEDGLVLLDYKTDRVASEEELAARYHIQMELYSRALEQITGKPVKEALIYSFALGQVIDLKVLEKHKK